MLVVGALLGPFRCRCPGVLIPLRGVEAEASEQGHGPRAHLCSDGPVGVPLPTFTLMSVWGRFGAPGTPRAAGPPGGRPGLLHLLAGQVRWAGRLPLNFRHFLVETNKTVDELFATRSA